MLFWWLFIDVSVAFQALLWGSAHGRELQAKEISSAHNKILSCWTEIEWASIFTQPFSSVLLIHVAPLNALDSHLSEVLLDHLKTLTIRFSLRFMLLKYFINLFESRLLVYHFLSRRIPLALAVHVSETDSIWELFALTQLQLIHRSIGIRPFFNDILSLL